MSKDPMLAVRWGGPPLLLLQLLLHVLPRPVRLLLLILPSIGG